MKIPKECMRVKDKDGKMLTAARSVMGRWKELFEELINEENERE